MINSLVPRLDGIESASALEAGIVVAVAVAVEKEEELMEEDEEAEELPAAVDDACAGDKTADAPVAGLLQSKLCDVGACKILEMLFERVAVLLCLYIRT